jgi:hypothetical protein
MLVSPPITLRRALVLLATTPPDPDRQSHIKPTDQSRPNKRATDSRIHFQYETSSKEPPQACAASGPLDFRIGPSADQRFCRCSYLETAVASLLSTGCSSFDVNVWSELVQLALLATVVMITIPQMTCHLLKQLVSSFALALVLNNATSRPSGGILAPINRPSAYRSMYGCPAYFPQKGAPHFSIRARPTALGELGEALPRLTDGRWMGVQVRLDVLGPPLSPFPSAHTYIQQHTPAADVRQMDAIC